MHQLIIIIPLLVNIAFITLFERKILSYAQLRKGPNKVRIIGLMQPLADAVKLFIKEVTLIKDRNKAIFLISPSLGIRITLILIRCIPSGYLINPLFLGIMLLVIIRLGVFPIFLEGWSSFSQYAYLGALRRIAQTISYEISLALLLFSVFIFSNKFSVSGATEKKLINILLLSPLIILLFISAVAETNRTPFDFAEGESELVSGFNTEYGAGTFALIFIAEYGIIIFFRLLLRILITQITLVHPLTLRLALLFIFLWVWLRATYPRFRYDKLLNLAWKSILPIRIILISYFTCHLLI